MSDVVVQQIREHPDSALIALDFDGTLSDITDDPESSRLVAGGIDALDALAARVRMLAIISGRAAADVVRLGGLDRVAGLHVLGHYGLQRWTAGNLTSPEPTAGVATARTALPQLLADAPEGVAVEDKTHSLVVHTRRTARPQPTLDALAPSLRRLAARCGLEAVPGRFVLELRPPGTDKGTALRSLIHEVAPDVVAYLGDDLGDLPAYDAVEAFVRDGGLGVTVGVAGEDSPAAVRDRAEVTLDGPAAVVAWLCALIP